LRYYISNDEADLKNLVAPAAGDHFVEVAGTGAGRAVLVDFIDGFLADERCLQRLRECTLRDLGFGTEHGGSLFDDDIDGNMEPFEGVLVHVTDFASSSGRDEEVVLSRVAFKRLVNAMVSLYSPHRTGLSRLRHRS